LYFFDIKGAAAVTEAVSSPGVTFAAVPTIPVAGTALILGVDRFMSGRAP
jgi:aerobic C4-dicarboxylate transport protein